MLRDDVINLRGLPAFLLRLQTRLDKSYVRERRPVKAAFASSSGAELFDEAESGPMRMRNVVGDDY